MKILLADDDMNKRERIIQFISLQKRNIKIDETKSYQSTLKSIFDNLYDLIILDMTMPTFDITIEENGGRVKVFAGKEIMRKMIKRNKQIPVIIMTQFESFGDDNIKFNELENELKSSYKKVFKEMIYYHNGMSGWQEKLEKHINNMEIN